MPPISFFLVAITILVVSEANVSSGGGLNQKLLVVSLDGFWWSYLNNRSGVPFLPWFTSFRDKYASADNVQSIFPSETFPNHYAIATGCYAETHGITANSIYDPQLNKTFVKSDTNHYWWDQAEPVWVTAEKQGKRTSVSFWPGSAAKFPPANYTPSYYRPVYSDSVPLEVLIDETVARLGNDSVDLALMYYYQPDSDGHSYGAPSLQVDKTLQKLDWYLSYLLLKLDQLDPAIRGKLNLVLCSDHGMVNITKFVFLEDYVSLTDDIERVPSYGAVANVWPKPGRTDRVLQMLKAASEKGEPFKAYRKQDLPSELHYSNNERIADIVVICDIGVFMYPGRPATKIGGGGHGFDPRHAAMRPIFMARGPAFKSGGYRSSSRFETKDIYAVIAHVVGIDSPTHVKPNASLERVADLFSAATSSAVTLMGAVDTTTAIIVLLFFVLIRFLLQ